MRNRFYIGLLGFERPDGKAHFARSIFSNLSVFCYNLSFDLFARERTDYSCFGEFEMPLSQWFGVVSKRSYFWHQAQVCMSLARASDDPALKQRYQDLALEFAQNAGGERDFDILLPSSCLSSRSNPTAATRANSYP
jgi:hypothetical protein